MSFDPDETISRLQSSTVRNALILVIVNVLTIVTVFTGKTLNIEAIKTGLDMGLPLAINVASVWWGWRAYRGRVIADTRIQPLPWKEEIQSLKEK